MDWVTLTANQLLLSTISKTSKKLLLIPESPNKLRWRLKKQKHNHYHPKPPMMILWSQHTIWGEVRETASQPINPHSCTVYSNFCLLQIYHHYPRYQTATAMPLQYVRSRVESSPFVMFYLQNSTNHSLSSIHTFVVERMKVLWLLCLPQLQSSYAYVDHFNMI